MAKRDEALEGWIRERRERTLKPMVESAAIMQLVPRQPETWETLDVMYALELGASILLGKPVIAIVMPGVEAPPKLLAVADKVIHGEVDTDEGRAHVQAEVDAFLKGLEQ